MTLGGLFAGIGGFELAAIMAGIEPIWSNENDPWCCKVLRKNFNYEIIEKDIRQICADTKRRGREAGARQGIQPRLKKAIRQNIGDLCEEKRFVTRPDILTGGFPCQPFSHAGKRKGKDDNRYLWPEYLRLIRELRPPWIIAENVAGLISMENESPFEKWLFIGMESQNCFRRIYSRYIYRKRQTYVLNQIIEDLEKENYTIETYNIPACSVGAWHKRERIWIVGHNANTGIERMQGRENTIRRCPNASNTQGTEQERAGDTRSGRNGFANTCENVPDTISEGLQGRDSGKLQECGFKWTPGKGNSQDNEQIWQPESGMGGMVARLSGRMDGYWDREPDIPRVAKGVKNRVNRLKGLGNAIVPRVAYEFFKAIIEFDNNQRSV